MGRHYELTDGSSTVQYIGVTSIIDDMLNKPALMKWSVGLACDFMRNYVAESTGFETKEEVVSMIDTAQKEWRSVQQEAMDVGTMVHNLAELHILKSLGEDVEQRQIECDKALSSMSADAKKQVAAGFEAFVDWENDNINQWVWSEKVLISNDFKYAGTADALAIMKDGRYILIDFKTSKGFYEGYDLQLAAYRLAYLETERENAQVDGIMCLRLDKETGKPETKEYKDIERITECWRNIARAWWLLKKRRLKAEGALDTHKYKLVERSDGSK